jgi:Cu2+-exporting ATPase
METLPKVNCFAFDKTGTLTSGEFSLQKLVLINSKNYTRAQVLAIAASLELHSEHPLALAFAQFRDFSINANRVTVNAGCGIEGIINSQGYKIGKPGWLLAQNSQEFNQYQQAQCVLTCNEALIAVFYFTDKIRDDAKSVINDLHEKNIKTLMISGDNKSGCEKISQQLSLDEVHYALSAQEKLNRVKKLQQNYTVAVVGDGINDSPVFGAAHVSIAMGSGSDVAKSGADVILLNNRLTSLQVLRFIATKTKRIINQNYLWAFGYNALILPLAVSGYITPYMAVIGMSASSILVITNSLRLLKKQLKVS